MLVWNPNGAFCILVGLGLALGQYFIWRDASYGLVFCLVIGATVTDVLIRVNNKGRGGRILFLPVWLLGVTALIVEAWSYFGHQTTP